MVRLEVPSVDVISHEQVIRVGATAADLEQLHQVVELPVNVPANGDRASHRLHIAHSHEHLTRLKIEHHASVFGLSTHCSNLQAQESHVFLLQWLAVVQLLNPRIELCDAARIHWNAG